jgi:hypothetical protein
MKTALLRNGCASEYWLRTTRSVLAIGIVAALALPNRLLAQKQETIGPPSIKVEVIAGQGATNNTRTRKAVEPIALVTDERGQPVSGVMVVFTLPETGPGGAFVDESKRAIVYTNAEGKATARGLTPNTTPGKFQIMVNASFQGFTSSTTVYQTNVSPERAKSSTKLIAILAIAGGAAAAGVVAASGGGGSSQSLAVPPSRTATTITPGTPIFGAPQQ